MDTRNTFNTTPSNIIQVDAIQLELQAGTEDVVTKAQPRTTVSPPASSFTEADEGVKSLKQTQDSPKTSQVFPHAEEIKTVLFESNDTYPQAPKAVELVPDKPSALLIVKHEPVASDGEEQTAQEHEQPGQHDDVTHSSSFIFRMGGDGIETIPFESGITCDPIPGIARGRYIQWFDQYRGRWVTRWQSDQSRW